MSLVKINLVSKKYDAHGVFDKGKVIIKKGSKINKDFNTNFSCSKIVKKLRDSEKHVDNNFIVTKDIEFSSPSTASQFVIGYSSNGWKTWRVESKEYLAVLKED